MKKPASAKQSLPKKAIASAKPSSPKKAPASAKPAAKKNAPVRAASKPAQGAASRCSATLATMLVAARPESPRPQVFARSLSVLSGPGPEERPVHLFIRCAPDAPADAYPGVRLHGTGPVRTATVPLGRVQELAAQAGVRRLSAPRELRPLMDIARPLVGVPQFRAQTHSSGQGVIIGIVDTGLDLNHPSFAGRVLSLWDQTLNGTGPGGNFVRLGQVLTGAAMAASTDTEGHGTHVAGIATGAGSPYEGVAPAADLIIVKTNFQNTGIAEGVRWIFAEATRLGRPAVVNLSLGGHGDGHDGTDDLSAVLDQESGPGRIVVAAAGNEGTDAIHAVRQPKAGQSATFTIRVASNTSGLAPEYFILNGWYSGAGTCEVRLRSSTGQTTPFQPVLTAMPTARQHALQNDVADIATPPAGANPNGDHQFLITVQPSFQGARVQGGIWTLEVRRASGQPGDLHVWLLLPPDARPGAAEFRGTGVTASHLIGSPGAAGEVVTVASYTSRNQWTDSTGVSRSVGLALDTISDFSSPGPRRDGVPKPDVTAPGAMIISTLASASVSPALAGSIVSPGFLVEAGTSMATPFITGVIALQLQQQPALTPAAAKAFLKQRSRVPGLAAGAHDPKWGHGLLKL